MTLELRSIIGKGDLRSERLTFRAIADLDIGDYVLLQSGYRSGSVTTDIHRAFWFPYEAISKGDLVVLYTRSGSKTSKPLQSKGVAHFFYWDLGEPIWADEDKAAVLLHAPTWESKSARELWK